MQTSKSRSIFNTALSLTSEQPAIRSGVIRKLNKNVALVQTVSGEYFSICVSKKISASVGDKILFSGLKYLSTIGNTRRKPIKPHISSV